MDRALVFGTRGCKFDSCWEHKNKYLGRLAQLVEQFPLKESVQGSSPWSLTYFKSYVETQLILTVI